MIKSSQTFKRQTMYIILNLFQKYIFYQRVRSLCTRIKIACLLIQISSVDKESGNIRTLTHKLLQI